MMNANLLRQISNSGLVTMDISSRGQYQTRPKKADTRLSSPLWFKRLNDETR